MSNTTGAEPEINTDSIYKEKTMSDLMTRIDRLLTEKQATGGDVAYKAFIEKKLKKWGVDSIDDLSAEDKKKFFSEVEKEWKADDE